MADLQPSILNVHTPSSSFAIVHSREDTLDTLLERLGQKAHVELKGEVIGPGWVKYSWNGSIWNLDDESDYTIFVWRQKSSASIHDAVSLHLHNPKEPLPVPPQYQNPSYYVFHQRASSAVSRSTSRLDGRSVKSGKSRKSEKPVEEDTSVPQFKREFEKFHNENGVRTIMGNIGPVQNVRMLLKSGYRHVYISRKFALRHGFIPSDAAPGHYGYGGLVNLGKWPIKVGRAKTMHAVYLSEEPHFDVVLGRSFWEARQVRTNPLDPTDVVCGDTDEKIDCELVILKDGKGQIVTVT